MLELCGRAVARIAHPCDRQRSPLGSVSLARRAEAGNGNAVFVISTNPLSLLATGGREVTTEAPHWPRRCLGRR